MTSTTGNLLALGVHGMWGFSPAFDLQEEVSTPSDNNPNSLEEDEQDPLNILVLSPGDIRHVLTTISRTRRWKKRPIHLYLFEKAPECLARSLLLLQIVNDWEIPLRQRCNTFLEVFGNALLQERTALYVEEKAKQLIDLVCNERGRLFDLVDLSHLKMKERDALVDVFHSWFTNVPCNLVKLRDQRMRHFYENRYDYRNNLVDWDYTMSLKKINDVSVIHIKQFKEWRNTGIAYEFGDQQYTVPNRTLSSYTEATKRGHGSVLCRGYWLDVVLGPYISFGVDCFKSNKFAEGLFEIHNKGSGCEQNRHNTSEVAVFNVLSYLHEIETGEVYKMKKAHDVYSGIGEIEDKKRQEGPNALETVPEDASQRFEILEDNQEDDAEEMDAMQRARKIIESFEGVKIVMLTGALSDLTKKQRYQRKFHNVHMSVHATSLLLKRNEEFPFTNILVDKAHVSIESSVFLLPLKDDQRIQYMEKLVEIAGTMGLETKKQTFERCDAYKKENAVLKFEYKHLGER